MMVFTFIAGSITGVCLALLVKRVVDEPLQGRIHIANDRKANMQWRWTLRDRQGAAIALGSGSHANRKSCVRSARRAVRYMKGVKFTPNPGTDACTN